jgi:hypothetical protein
VKRDPGDGPGGIKDSAKARRWFYYFCLLAVLAAGLLVRARGIDSSAYNPDELAIAEWTRQGEPDRTYAQGFFVLVAPARWVCETITRTVTMAHYFTGSASMLPREYNLGYYVGMNRWFNAVLGALTCALVFMCAARVTSSRAAGLLAAALMAFQVHHVNHSHYGETNIAMVFMLSAGLWFWILWVADSGKRYFAAAALALGFAAGTKFPLATLLPVFTLQCVLLPRSSSRNLRRRLLFAGGGILLFTVGFYFANPQMNNLSAFLAGLKHEGRRLAAETSHNMGQAAGNDIVKYKSHLLTLGRCLSGMGPVWLALAACGLGALFHRATRKFWIPFLVFPAVYTGYWVFFSPWVRTQEFLNYLPFFSILAAMTARILWRPSSKTVRTAVAVLASAAVLWAAHYAVRATSAFQWKDSRELAERWLMRHGPADATYAREGYAGSVETPGREIDISSVEIASVDSLRKQGADFVIRTGYGGGRGVRHPLTGRMYPLFAERHRKFVRQSDELAAWGLLPPDRYRPGFNSWLIRLLALDNSVPTGVNIDLPLPRPLFVGEEGRKTCSAAGGNLGTFTGTLVDRYRRRLAIGGPMPVPDRTYVILNTVPRAAAVKVKGLRQKKKVSLAPYEARVVTLKKPGWPPLSTFWAPVDLRADPAENMLYIPCFARVAFSEDEVLRTLLDLQQWEALARFIDNMPFRQGVSPVLLYRAAVRCGNWEVANLFLDSAEAEVSRLRTGVGAENPEFRINGVRSSHYDRFARVRLYPETHLVARIVEKAGQGAPAPYRAEIKFPVRIAGGRYNLTGACVFKDLEKPAELILSPAGKEKTIRRLGIPAGSGRKAFSVPFDVERESTLRLELYSRKPAEVLLEDLVLRWESAALLNSELNRYILSRACHLVHDRKYTQALRQLDFLRRPFTGTAGIERRRLAFEARCGIDPQAEDTLQSARMLLDLAPRHYRALMTAASTDPSAAGQTDRLRPVREKSVLFRPLLRCLGYSFDQEKRRLSLFFEALRNETPKQEVCIYAEKKGKWRRLQSRVISGDLPLSTGERVRVDMKLHPGVPRKKIRFGVRSGVKWQPERLAVDGYADNLVPLELQQ